MKPAAVWTLPQLNKISILWGFIPFTVVITTAQNNKFCVIASVDTRGGD